MPAPVITVENLGKLYHLGLARHDTLHARFAHGVQTALGRLRGEVAPDPTEFWALRDVSFEVGQGDVLGIIGPNGAGKSTLLKILSRITEPTTGRVAIRGRVASLLEVGTGFHPELTGRDNIFLNGAILGMTRAEITRKFDEIVAFAEVEKFIDTPVKRYSSGMYVRLAFAVAAHLEPEILVVDEVLAVGDVQFQRKCLGKMQSVAASEGRTVLFVSHNTSAVQSLCLRTLVLKSGTVAFFGGVAEGLQHYLQSGLNVTGRILDHQQAPATGCPIHCLDVSVNGRTDDRLALADALAPLEIEMLIEARAATRLSLECYLTDRYGGRLAFASPGHDGSGAHVHNVEPGRYRLRGTLTLPHLIRGQYQLELALIQPFVCKFIGFPGAVEISVDGSGTTWGRLFEQAPTSPGVLIMPGTVAVQRIE